MPMIIIMRLLIMVIVSPARWSDHQRLLAARPFPSEGSRWGPALATAPWMWLPLRIPPSVICTYIISIPFIPVDLLPSVWPAGSLRNATSPFDRRANRERPCADPRTKHLELGERGCAAARARDPGDRRVRRAPAARTSEGIQTEFY